MAGEVEKAQRVLDELVQMRRVMLRNLKRIDALIGNLQDFIAERVAHVRT